MEASNVIPFPQDCLRIPTRNGKPDFMELLIQAAANKRSRTVALVRQKAGLVSQEANTIQFPGKKDTALT